MAWPAGVRWRRRLDSVFQTVRVWIAKEKSILHADYSAGTPCAQQKHAPAAAIVNARNHTALETCYHAADGHGSGSNEPRACCLCASRLRNSPSTLTLSPELAMARTGRRRHARPTHEPTRPPPQLRVANPPGRQASSQRRCATKFPTRHKSCSTTCLRRPNCRPQVASTPSTANAV